MTEWKLMNQLPKLKQIRYFCKAPINVTIMLSAVLNLSTTLIAFNIWIVYLLPGDNRRSKP